jgi:hypothetical protein
MPWLAGQRVWMPSWTRAPTLRHLAGQPARRCRRRRPAQQPAGLISSIGRRAGRVRATQGRIGCLISSIGRLAGRVLAIWSHVGCLTVIRSLRRRAWLMTGPLFGTGRHRGHRRGARQLDRLRHRKKTSRLTPRRRVPALRGRRCQRPQLRLRRLRRAGLASQGALGRPPSLVARPGRAARARARPRRRSRARAAAADNSGEHCRY